MSEGITGNQLAEGVLTVLSKPFELSHAEILAWPTTPIEVIPATQTLNYAADPTYLFWPIAIQLIFHTLAGAYTNVADDAQFRVNVGSDQSDTVLYLTEFNALASLSNPAFNIASFGLIGNAETANAAPDSPHSHPIIPLRLRLHNNLKDNAVMMSLRNGSAGNLTGGHVNNWVKGEILYRRLAL